MPLVTPRRLFATVALTSLVGMTAFGAVFAWRTSDSARGAALVGSNGFKIRYDPVCSPAAADVPIPADPDASTDPTPIPCLTLIGYNGVTTKVGEGAGANRGDFPLVVVGGRLTIRHVIPRDLPAPATEADAPDAEVARPCGVEDFSGVVRLLNPGEVIPPGGEGGKFAAAVTVSPTAPRSCQGDIVLYRIVIEAENPPAVSTDPVPPAPVAGAAGG